MQGKRESITNKESLVPTSVYTDIHIGNLLQCAGIFSGQVMLYCLAMQGVLDREIYADRTIPTKSTLFFCAGTVVAFMQEVVNIIDDQWKKEWEDFWCVYFAKRGPGFRPPSHHHPWIRVVMSFLVNNYFMKTMITVLPCALMESSDSMEFVKDATSILFIAKIDDVLFSWSHHVPLSDPPRNLNHPTTQEVQEVSKKSENEEADISDHIQHEEEELEFSNEPGHEPVMEAKHSEVEIRL